MAGAKINVRLLKGYAAPDGERDHHNRIVKKQPGDILALTKQEAQRLLDAKVAEIDLDVMGLD